MHKSKRLTTEQIVEIERLTKTEHAREKRACDQGQSQLYQYLSEVVLKSPLTA
ncbi:MAG: hypothetical protein ACREYC_26485 [Gammaproteobacteria bacterium]